MKRKTIGATVTVVLSLFALVGCGNEKLAQPKLSKATNSYQKVTPKVSASKISEKQKKDSEQESVKAFLKAYTTYLSLNAQKSQIKSFLSSDLQKAWAVGNPASPTLNQVMSNGEVIQVSQGSAHVWFAIVKVTVNEQTTHLAVFEIQTVKNKDRVQISSCTDLNQE
jgi:thiamine biosynthesis lipoprotein ApbE